MKAAPKSKPERESKAKTGRAATGEWKNQVMCEDALAGLARIPDGAVDLLIADPPYNLGKDYGNDSDKRETLAYLEWTQAWIDKALPKLKPNGSLYIFLTWRYSPEIFVMLKQRLTMINEIIWDRRVPSMGGSVRRYSSVHDTIGFFTAARDYYFDLDAIRVPYDAVTKKARSRSIFLGAKWLELGYNPKDVWSVSRLHREHREREDHPTQKPLEIIERMIRASCPPGGLVLDPFLGSGTTAVAAQRCGRDFAGFELNEEYCRMIRERLAAPENAPAAVHIPLAGCSADTAAVEQVARPDTSADLAVLSSGSPAAESAASAASRTRARTATKSSTAQVKAQASASKLSAASDDQSALLTESPLP